MLKRFKSQKILLLVVLVFVACVPKTDVTDDRLDPNGTVYPTNPNNPTNPTNPTNPDISQPYPNPSTTNTSVPPGSTRVGNVECIQAEQKICEIEYLIVEKTNGVRAKFGRKPMQYDAKLGYIARQWSKDMGAAGKISHDAFKNGDQAKRYQTAFRTSRQLSRENVAMTGMRGASSSAEDVATSFVRMWSFSPGHLMNMLSGQPYLGAGVALSADGSWYATQLFSSN